MSIETNEALTTQDIVGYWQDAQDERLEGSSGLQLLKNFLGMVGYEQERYAGCKVGEPIEEFLKDNPDAIQALIDWAAEEFIGGDPDVRQAFIDALPAECEYCSEPVDVRGNVCQGCQEDEDEDSEGGD